MHHVCIVIHSVIFWSKPLKSKPKKKIQKSKNKKCTFYGWKWFITFWLTELLSAGRTLSLLSGEWGGGLMAQLYNKVLRSYTYVKKVWFAALGGKLYLFCATLLYGVFLYFLKICNFFLVVQRPKKNPQTFFSFKIKVQKSKNVFINYFYRNLKFKKRLNRRITE